MLKLIIFSYLSVFCTAVLAFGEFVILTNNGPVVQGAEVTFTAKVYTSSGNEAKGHFEYSWEDNGMPFHSRSVKSDSYEDRWSVTYPAEHYPPGPYRMQVEVYTCIIFCFPLTSNRVHFNITAKLNGQMNLIQNNTIRTTQFISNSSIVEHSISLYPPDYAYLKNNATNILTYWFIDCQYYGMTSNFNFSFKYNVPDSQHVVEALIVAGFEPITTPAPTTTSTTTIATTTSAATTSKLFKTTEKINTNSNDIPKDKVKRDVQANVLNIYSSNGSMITLSDNNTFPYVCLNQTNIAPDPKKAYGYFSRTMVVKAPVNNITVTGNYWLQHGEILNLDIKCTGSMSFKYCIIFLVGIHNVTGNETCDYVPDEKDECEFNVARYYKNPGEFTVLVIIKNDVSQLIYPIAVNVYKVTKRPQLSVIVVPVSFSLVAVVLIVFGMAYYIQNQRRFTVEVANFDFGKTYGDMEYKTFRERLRDSVSNALTRTPTTDQSETPSNWPSSSRKYGSMT